jgi:hypothetical protein
MTIIFNKQIFIYGQRKCISHIITLILHGFQMIVIMRKKGNYTIEEYISETPCLKG